MCVQNQETGLPIMLTEGQQGITVLKVQPVHAKLEVQVQETLTLHIDQIAVHVAIVQVHPVLIHQDDLQDHQGAHLPEAAVRL